MGRNSRRGRWADSFSRAAEVFEERALLSASGIAAHHLAHAESTHGTAAPAGIPMKNYNVTAQFGGNTVPVQLPAILSISDVPLRAGAVVQAHMSLNTVYLGDSITLTTTIHARVESWEPMGVGTSVALSAQGKMVEKIRDSTGHLFTVIGHSNGAATTITLDGGGDFTLLQTSFFIPGRHHGPGGTSDVMFYTP